MPPSSKVSTRSVNRPSRSAIQLRAGMTASSPWFEMLGKAKSSSSSSMKRREFFSMYASTALVEITRSLLRNLGAMGDPPPRPQAAGPPHQVGRPEFHFSPRPNRAHEIKWRGWSDDAFAEAGKLHRPTLLLISAAVGPRVPGLEEKAHSHLRVNRHTKCEDV